MKILIALIILSSLNAFACNRSVNSKKAVIFIDTNAGYTEIKAAREAACARGERFILVPKNDIKKIKAVQDTYAKQYWYDKTKSKICSEYGWSSSNCDEASDKHRDLYSKFSDSKKELTNDPNYKKVTNESVKEALRSLAEEGVKPQSVIMSGHNGGSDISGTMGQVNKQTVLSDMNEVYSNNPDLLQEFNSLLLWGCWTNTMDKTTAHKLEMPSLDVIAGFHGMGPLSIYSASPTLLKSVLLKEDQMSSASSSRRLKSVIDSLDNVHHTLAGIYTDLSCGGEYYYHRTGNSSRTQTHFGEFKADVNCWDLEETLRPKAQLINRYMSGEEAVPEDNRDSPLRAIYSFARQNAIFKDQCDYIDNIVALDGNKIGLLRFFEGVKENFDKVFTAEREQMWNDIKTLKTTDLEKNLLGAYENDLTKSFQKLDGLMKQQQDLKQELSEVDGSLLESLNNVLGNSRLMKKLDETGLSDLFQSKAERVSDDLVAALEDFINNDVKSSRHKKLLSDYLDKANLAKKAYQKVLEKNKPLSEASSEYHDLLLEHTKAKMEVKRLKEALDEIPMPSSATEFKNMSRKDINQYVHKLDALGSFSKSILKKNSGSETERIISRAKKHVQSVDRMLVNLDTDCMEFLDWHEAVDGHMPTVNCSL